MFNFESNWRKWELILSYEEEGPSRNALGFFLGFFFCRYSPARFYHVDMYIFLKARRYRSRSFCSGFEKGGRFLGPFPTSRTGGPFAGQRIWSTGWWLVDRVDQNRRLPKPHNFLQGRIARFRNIFLGYSICYQKET